MKNITIQNTEDVLAGIKSKINSLQPTLKNKYENGISFWLVREILECYKELVEKTDQNES